jgi:hypothetical protein
VASVAVALTGVDVLPVDESVAESVVLIVCAVAGALYCTPTVMLPFAAVVPAAVIAL